MRRRPTRRCASRQSAASRSGSVDAGGWPTATGVPLLSTTLRGATGAGTRRESARPAPADAWRRRRPRPAPRHPANTRLPTTARARCCDRRQPARRRAARTRCPRSGAACPRRSFCTSTRSAPSAARSRRSWTTTRRAPPGPRRPCIRRARLGRGGGAPRGCHAQRAARTSCIARRADVTRSARPAGAVPDRGGEPADQERAEVERVPQGARGGAGRRGRHRQLRHHQPPGRRAGRGAGRPGRRRGAPGRLGRLAAQAQRASLTWACLSLSSCSRAQGVVDAVDALADTRRACV